MAPFLLVVSMFSPLTEGGDPAPASVYSYFSPLSMWLSAPLTCAQNSQGCRLECVQGGGLPGGGAHGEELEAVWRNAGEGPGAAITVTTWSCQALLLGRDWNWLPPPPCRCLWASAPASVSPRLGRLAALSRWNNGDLYFPG